MFWLLMLIVLAVVYVLFRSWFETPIGHLVLDGIGLAVVLVLFALHGLNNSTVMWIELVIGIAVVYDAVLQLRQLKK